MTTLSQQHCEACQAGAPRVTDQEKSDLLSNIPAWETVTLGGEEQLRRVFKFKNYAEALAFINTVADLAEAENHHPAILLEWGKATVRWWTHKIGGLHRNDFIMAARTDGAYRGG